MLNPLDTCISTTMEPNLISWNIAHLVLPNRIITKKYQEREWKTKAFFQSEANIFNNNKKYHQKTTTKKTNNKYFPNFVMDVSEISITQLITLFQPFQDHVCNRFLITVSKHKLWINPLFIWKKSLLCRLWIGKH